MGGQREKDLQEQSHTWVLDRKAELEKLYNVEKAELRAMIQKEHETPQQQYHRFDQSQADSALRKLEMVEQFHQQKKEFQEEIQRRCRSTMEEYKRDCDVAAQLTIDTNV